MNQIELEQLIIEVLREIQSKSGQPPSKIDRQTHPLGGIPGFDSVLAVEASVELEHHLGREVPDINVFFDEDDERTLSIQEAAENLYRLLNVHGGTHDR